MTTGTEKLLQAVLDKTVDGKKIFGACFAIKNDTFKWIGASGNMTVEQPYFIASTTKLFTTALILQLRADGRLGLDDPISKYVNPALLSGLHTFRGKDYTPEITIKHLLAHTSGLPDYFQGKAKNGNSLEKETTAGNDQVWSMEDVVHWTKSMSPPFAPGTPGKAHYSDANYQLLGKIIETITQKSYAENCQVHIIQPLGLISTYVYTDASDNTPLPLFYKSEPLHIPQAMVSFGADGGIVSTSADMLTFIEAFFNGQLFPSPFIDELQVWNKIFFPMQSGIGIHLFKLPWIFNPTGAVPPFIGHSGLSGALAFFSPKHRIWLAGTVNQIAYPDVSFRTMIKLTRHLLNRR